MLVRILPVPRRRPLVVTAVVAAAACVAAGLALAVAHLPLVEARAAYLGWRDGDPRGELAGDRGVHDAVLRAWADRTGMASQDAVLLTRSTGPTRLVWAGRVGGVAGAVVTQPAHITGREMPGLDEGVDPRHDVWGYLRLRPDGTATVAAVTAHHLPNVWRLHALGGWLDPTAGIGLVLSLGTPLVVSETVELTPAGVYGRTARPLPFRSDGTAVVDIDDAIGRYGVVVGPASRPLTDIYGLSGSLETDLAPLVLDWSGRAADGPSVIPITGAAPPAAPTEGLLDTFTGAVVSRLARVPNMSYATTGWLLGGRLADGTTVTVGTVNAGGTHRLVSLTGTRYADHGVLDPAAPLPIAVRLPGGRGWVVAAPRATLRHRPPGGSWRPAGLQAAVVPDTGPVEVEVGRTGRRPAVVSLA
ncbi:MAG TPA: hypothetical protein VNV66_15875 [Pilimelia sp.]|nr:hypothetical protein [Pilimelia sp.]